MTGTMPDAGERAGKTNAGQGLPRWADWCGSAVVSVVVAAVPGPLLQLWSTNTWAGRLLMIFGAVAAGCLVFGYLTHRSRRAARHRRWAWRVGAVTALLAVVMAAVVALEGDESAAPAPRDDCGRSHPAGTAEVVITWEDEELDAFCEVVAAYGPGVEVTSAGQDIAAYLQPRLSSADPPDLAIAPQTSLVQRYATRGLLCPLDELAGNDRFPAQWTDLVTAQVQGSGPENVYGVFVKGAHKSLFWYGPALVDPRPPKDPELWTWDDMTAWAEETRGSRQMALLTLPAGDRWPLTDWFENQLAVTDPELYDALAANQGVNWHDASVAGSLRTTLQTMADFWRTPDLLAGGAEGALATRWEQMPQQVDDGQAALMFGPSFLAGPVGELPAGRRLYPFGFPGTEQRRPLVVGGDIAMVPERSGSCGNVTAGTHAAEWLVGGEAIRRWGESDRGFLTPNAESPYVRSDDAQAPPDNEDDVHVYLTYQLRHPPDGRLHFDLSDDQFANANEGDPRGAWDILHGFFVEVTGSNPDIPCAIDRAIVRLEAEYQGDGSPSDPAGCPAP